MKLQDLLESDLNISITITIKELKEFADYLLQQSKDDIERLILETKQPKEYLTPNETAKLLHVNRSTLYQWNKNGYLRVIEVGGKRLYRQSDIDAYNASTKQVDLKYLKLLNLHAKVNCSSSSLELLFNSDKLLKLMAFIGSKSSSTALKTVSSLAENYDGMMLGFQLSK